MIEALLAYPNGQEPAILDAQPDLIDAAIRQPISVFPLKDSQHAAAKPMSTETAGALLFLKGWILEALYPVLQAVTGTLATKGSFNYLRSDGEHFFAHCSTHLCYIIRQAPFAAAHLIAADLTVDFQPLTTPRDRVTLITTVPLTDNEVWTTIQPGELLVFQDGLPVKTSEVWLGILRESLQPSYLHATSRSYVSARS